MTEQANGTGQESGTGTAGTGQEPSGQQGAAAEGSQGQESGAGAGGQGQGFDIESITDPAVKSYVQEQQRRATEASREAQQHRANMRTLEERLTAMERAGESEQQRQERERTESEAERQRILNENRDLKASGAVITAATAAKAQNPGLVYDLIKPRLEYGTDGKPTNADALVADLKAREPYLFTRVRQPADAGGGGGSATPSMNDSIRAAARRNQVTQET